MSEKLKMVRSSGSVFRDLGFSEEEAQNLALRSDLIIRIQQLIEQSGATQQQAAKTFGVTQPRMNALLKGKIGAFSLDALVKMLSRAGMQVKMTVRKAA